MSGHPTPNFGHSNSHRVRRNPFDHFFILYPPSSSNLSLKCLRRYPRGVFWELGPPPMMRARETTTRDKRQKRDSHLDFMSKVFRGAWPDPGIKRTPDLSLRKQTEKEEGGEQGDLRRGIIPPSALKEKVSYPFTNAFNCHRSRIKPIDIP